MSNLFETGIRPAIDAYLKAKSEEVRSYGDYWSASSAGYCMRLNIMRRLGVDKVPELQEGAATQTRIFEAGHIFHEWLQRITKDAGLSIASEVELQDEELMIRGHFDDLVLVNTPFTIDTGSDTLTTNVPEPHLILYDYKTANSQSFNYKKDEIGHYHKMQLGTYMYMLRKHPVQVEHRVGGESEFVPDEYMGMLDKLSEARILQISKDDLRMREYQLMWSPQLEKEIVGYWRTLNGYWKAQTMPKCTCLDYDGGFMGKRSKKGKIYCDFFYNDQPCSLEWYRLWKANNRGGDSNDSPPIQAA